MSATVQQLLGLRGRVRGRLELADHIQQGLPAGAIDQVKEALALADRDLAAALGISAKTLARFRKAGERVPSPVGDRLYRVALIWALAREVLEDEDSARGWLGSPQIGLNDRVPMKLLATEAGAREVEELLMRIEHGVYA